MWYAACRQVVVADIIVLNSTPIDPESDLTDAAICAIDGLTICGTGSTAAACDEQTKQNEDWNSDGHNYVYMVSV